jgi:osmotically-inducible protein OsmY
MDESPSGRGEPTPYLVARVREALAHSATVAALDIHVRIVDHDLFLTGCVSTDARRVAAEEVVRAEAPGLSIHNHLDVAAVGPPTGREEIR